MNPVLAFGGPQSSSEYFSDKPGLGQMGRAGSLLPKQGPGEESVFQGASGLESRRARRGTAGSGSSRMLPRSALPPPHRSPARTPEA